MAFRLFRVYAVPFCSRIRGIEKPTLQINKRLRGNTGMSSEKEKVFKTCPMCAKNWKCRDTFLDDPDLNFNGYQANFGIIEHGLFYFTHQHAVCGSTMALEAERFFSLYKGERYEENKMLSEECSGKCLDRTELDRCQAHCEFSFAREVSQIIKDRSHRLI